MEYWTEWSSDDAERALHDAVAAVRAELAPHVVRARRRVDRATIGVDETGDVGGGLADELDAEPRDAGGGELREHLHGALRLGVEDRVAASDVRFDGMVHPRAIAERHAVPVAWTAARLVVLAFGEE